MAIAQLLADQKVIPVITVKDIKHAVPLAEALNAGGISVFEITLRSEPALQAITAIRKALPIWHWCRDCKTRGGRRGSSDDTWTQRTACAKIT